MYQDSKPRRRAGLGGGGRHGDSFWREESGNTGLKLLSAMGWQQGQGLGKDKQGTTTHVKAKLKSNNAGIGGTAKDEGAAFAAANTACFNDLLRRLNEEHNDGDNSADSDSDAENGKAAIASVSRAIARRGLYGRFLAAKDTARYSDKQMAEIFGKKKEDAKETAVAAVVTATATTTTTTVVAQDTSLITTTSKVSMADYFAAKRAKATVAAANGTTAVTASRAITQSPVESGSGSDAAADDEEDSESEAARLERKRQKKEAKRAAKATAAAADAEANLAGVQKSSKQDKKKKRKRDESD